MTNTVNVSIWIPSDSVETMKDELADGTVDAAVKAVQASALVEVDSDGDVPVKSYSQDFDNGVEEALAYAATTEGRDVLVIITDLKCDDRAKAERLLAAVENSDDTVIIVPESNDGFDEAWAELLDGGETNGVDVIRRAQLTDRKVVLAEVGPRVGVSV